MTMTKQKLRLVKLVENIRATWLRQNVGGCIQDQRITQKREGMW